MEIINHGSSKSWNNDNSCVEIRDGSFEITFWRFSTEGEIVISGVGCDDVTFGGLPVKLMNKIQQAIIEYKKESNDE